MNLLKVGRNYLFLDHVKHITAPATHANQPGAAVVRFCDGTSEAFYGAESEEIQAWLAKQLEPSEPATVPFQTKAAEPKPATKDRR